MNSERAKKDYRTEGREKLIGFLSVNPDRQFTVEELCVAVNGTDGHGKSSIYRHLNELCERGDVRRFRGSENESGTYQYIGKGCDCGSHFHEKCVLCGKVEHLDCRATEEFSRHLLSEYGFEVFCGQSMLYGVCAECRKAGKGGSAHA